MAVQWTTQQSGNWSLASTDPLSPWYDGGTQTGYARTPGSSTNANGDLVAIANGHDLVLDINAIIGDPTTQANAAIKTAGTGGTGTFTVNSGVQLDVVSNVVQGNATWKFNAGSTFRFNHATSNLTWQVCDGTPQLSAHLKFLGTSGSRCTVTSVTAKGWFTRGGGSSSCSHTAQYTDFSYVGDATHDCLQPGPANAATTTDFLECTFDNCGVLNASSAIAASSYFRQQNCKFTNSLGTMSANYSAVTDVGTGTRLVQGCVYDKVVGNVNNYRGFTFRKCWFENDISVAITSSNPWVVMDECYRGRTNATVGNIAGPFGDTVGNYVLGHGSTTLSNLSLLLFSPQLSITAKNNIFDWGDTDTTGQALTFGSATGSVTYTINNNLHLPNSSGNCPGKFVALGGNSNVKVLAYHNTVFTANQAEAGVVQFAETYEGYKGQYECMNNLAYGSDGWIVKQFNQAGPGTFSATNGNAAITGSGTTWQSSTTQALASGNKFIDTAAGTAYLLNTGPSSDTAINLPSGYGGTTGSSKAWKTIAMDSGWNAGYNAVDYNAGWGLSTGSDGVGYDSNTSGVAMFTTAPGPHDVTVGSNPFKDSTRNMATYAVAVGAASSGDSYATKIAGAKAYIKTDVTSRIADLIGWVGSGYNVHNTSLKNAGSDGATIGAMPYEDSTVKVPMFLLQSAGRIL